METRNCQNCKKDFNIEPDDFGFYEKISVPAPTFCPDCRRQRRWAWRNNMSLYSRKCEQCDKSVVSLYSPESDFTVYCNKCWWKDTWSPIDDGVDYDFSRPFFSQFRDLLQKVPQIAVVNDDGIASINCEYTHDWWFSKDCYMCFVGWRAENVMYSFFVLAGKNMMDCMNIRSTNEWMYECIMSSQSYQLKYSEFSKSCLNSQFLYNCVGCSDCFMCFGLHNKKYNFKNEQYSKEEYEKILESYRLDTFSGVEKANKEFNSLLTKFHRRFAQIYHSTNCTGDIISFSKNVKNSFIIKNGENIKYSDFAGGSAGSKDSYDITTSGEMSECYETIVADHSQLNLFGIFSVKSQDIRYSQHCHNCKHVFGCVGLRNSSYCILNKQYTKEEYEALLPKVIEHMNTMPYIDKMGIVYKYGEFYPIELSVFGYNESHAPELVPFSKEEAQIRGYNWQDNVQRTTGKETITPENIPESIHDISDTITDEVLSCIECKRNYKIIPNELTFYRKMLIPIPRRCFYCRHQARINKRNPFKLWHRACMCDMKGHEHEGKCAIEFETTYSPERPEAIYCEKCFQIEFN